MVRKKNWIFQNLVAKVWTHIYYTFVTLCPDFRDRILEFPDIRDPSQTFRDPYPDFRDPCPDIRDQILVCLNYRDPRATHFETFQTQTLSATLKFECKSVCGATHGAKLSPAFPVSTFRRDYESCTVYILVAKVELY